MPLIHIRSFSLADYKATEPTLLEALVGETGVNCKQIQLQPVIYFCASVDCPFEFLWYKNDTHISHIPRPLIICFGCRVFVESGVK